MIEFILLSGLLAILALAAGILLVFGFLLKMVFRLLLLPFVLLGGVLKLVLLLPLIILGLVVAPVLFTIVLVLALPILLVAGLFGLGWAAVAA